MNASSDRVFYYHADASPIGGYLTHPFEKVLPTNSSVSLSQAGGHSNSRVENFHLDDLIRTGAHYSQVTGSVEKQTGNWTTLVTSVVEDLNVLQVVTADRIVSQLTIEHSSKPGQYYPKIAFTGSQYENLRINGKDVVPAVNLDLLSAPEPDGDVRSVIQDDMLPVEAASSRIEFPDMPWTNVSPFVSRAVAQSQNILNAEGAPEWLKSRFQWVPLSEERAKRGYILASLVNGVHGVAPGSSFGHVVHIPSFGNIFLGELIVTPVAFHATMLRVEMGCAATGNVSFGTTHGNGSPMP